MSKVLEVMAAVCVPLAYGLLVSLFFDRLRRRRAADENGENSQ